MASAVAPSLQPLAELPRVDSVSATPMISYPSIEAKFETDKYLLREAMLVMRKDNHECLPRGYPNTIRTPAVWTSDTLDVEEITHRASQTDVRELENAVHSFKASKLGLNELSPGTFPLPNLGYKLREVSKTIHEGRGAAIIKGLCPSDYTMEDNIIMFAGLSSYVGDQRGRQSALGDVLTHLYSTRDKSIQDPRPGLSTHGLPFHNDHCDILALYVMETAVKGGKTRWASGGQIYNEMARTKPQAIKVLAEGDWPHETPTKAVKYLPLMFQNPDEAPFLSFTRFALTGLPTYPRGPDSPELSPEQADALDTLQYLAEKHAVEIEQEKGDILLLNNRDVLHARDRIEDSPDTSQRHLLRLCLRDTEYGRPIPEDLKRRWGDIFDNDQNEHGKWVIDKDHDSSFVSSSKFDALFTNDETTGSHG
ncbi:hypothetical protein PG993_015052 [Apiospora rasikravindrae]|uniref:TauD/TfdA-like domain-containing protein n=1 Tax=Apiospora rasikravindrae TaxID=990691 RepID=A0ABR1RRL1_9PEZI